MKTNIICLALLLAFLSAFAVQEPFSTASTTPQAAMLSLVSLVLEVVVPIMFIMIVIAAAVYMVGQAFGAETRAKANVWAQRMIVGVGMSAAIIIVMVLIVPNIMTGGMPGATTSISYYIQQLVDLARISLTGLILACVVLAAFVFMIGQVSGAETRARASAWTNGLLGAAILSACLYLLLFELLPILQGVLTESLTPFASGIIAITLFISIVIIITYLLSNVFKIPEWEAYLNIEMSNLYVSFLVVIFAFGLFTVGNVVATDFISSVAGGVMGTTYGAVATPPQAAIVYMRSVVADSVLKGMYDIYQIQVCTSVMGTFSRRIGEAVLTQVFRIFPGIDTFVSICNVLSMGLVSVYGSLQAQIGLLYLVDGMMMPFFLPAGLVLRFLPPTREAGAFLISLAFGFQIIYPMTYLINAEIFKEIGAQPYSSPTAIIYSLCGPVKYGFWGYMLNPNTLPVSTANALFPGGAPFFLFLSRLVSESTLNFVSMSEFFPILQNVAGLSLLALFMPALSMMVTIAFINAMTKFLVAKV